MFVFSLKSNVKFSITKMSRITLNQPVQPLFCPVCVHSPRLLCEPTTSSRCLCRFSVNQVIVVFEGDSTSLSFSEYLNPRSFLQLMRDTYGIIFKPLHPLVRVITFTVLSIHTACLLWLRSRLLFKLMRPPAADCFPSGASLTIFLLKKGSFSVPQLPNACTQGIIVCWDSLWNATVKGLVFNVPEEPVKTNCCHIVILI